MYASLYEHFDSLIYRDIETVFSFLHEYSYIHTRIYEYSYIYTHIYEYSYIYTHIYIYEHIDTTSRGIDLLIKGGGHPPWLFLSARPMAYAKETYGICKRDLWHILSAFEGPRIPGKKKVVYWRSKCTYVFIYPYVFSSICIFIYPHVFIWTYVGSSNMQKKHKPLMWIYREDTILKCHTRLVPLGFQRFFFDIHIFTHSMTYCPNFFFFLKKSFI